MAILGDCPVCATPEVEKKRSGGGEDLILCPACGDFYAANSSSISVALERLRTADPNPDTDVRFKASWALRGWMERSRLDGGAAALTAHTIDGLVKQLRPWSAQRSERLLLQLVRERSTSAYGAATIGEHDWAQVEVPGAAALSRLVAVLVARGDLVSAEAKGRHGLPLQAVLTGAGESRVEAGPKESVGSRRT